MTQRLHRSPDRGGSGLEPVGQGKVEPPALPAHLTTSYLEWLEAPDRERQERVIETLEEIRSEHGPGWAIYCSAFCHGPMVREWRRAIIEEVAA